jgi:hypothetical protein
MRKLIFITVVCAFLAVPSLADMKVTVFDGVGSTNGGEFLDKVLDDSIGIYPKDSFISTFCVETQEYISIGGTYYVTLSNAAIKGSTQTSDPLSDESAWVYTDWLDNLEHTQANADLVQNAIWFLENEPGYGANNAEAQLASAAVAGGWRNSDIMVMNLWNNSDHTNNAQDHLVRVPVPAAVLLGMLGFCVAGLKLRKFP